MMEKKLCELRTALEKEKAEKDVYKKLSEKLLKERDEYKAKFEETLTLKSVETTTDKEGKSLTFKGYSCKLGRTTERRHEQELKRSAQIPATTVMAAGTFYKNY